MRIAVIGGGIAGLSAAWLLSKKHEVTLLEKNKELGGHAHTAIVNFNKTKIPVDTAFIVFNEKHYPNLTAFFKTLGIVTDPVKMVLSVSLDNGAFEWSTRKYSGIFADSKNIISPAFWHLIKEINRFNSVARKSLANNSVGDDTLNAFLERYSFSAAFRTRYLFPVASAIWSVSSDGIGNSPAYTTLSFLDNHDVLRANATERANWRTVHHGSRQYVDVVAKELHKHGSDIRLNTCVTRVSRADGRVTVQTDDGSAPFDYVVMATHADTTLSLLEEPTKAEKDLLSPFRYECNEVYLHGDESFMPRRRKAWGTWAYLGESISTDGSKKAQLTYYMNALQHIDPKYPLFVTLNPVRLPVADKIYEHYAYHHPIYSPQAIAAQTKLGTLQNKQHSLFCGSYFGHGFHEDGIRSAVDAVRHLGIEPPWKA